MFTFRLSPRNPIACSCVICWFLRSWRSYRNAVAGVSINDPATMVLMNGRPKSRKGCFRRALRYLAARVLGRVARKEFEANGPGIVNV